MEQNLDILEKELAREAARLKDEETDITLKRKKLFIVCGTSVIVSITGAIPQKIDALGIVFSPSDKNSWEWILLLTSFYFLSHFIVKSFVYVKSQLRYFFILSKIYRILEEKFQIHDIDISKQLPADPTVGNMSFFFDFIFPAIFGIAAIGLMVFRIFN